MYERARIYLQGKFNSGFLMKNHSGNLSVPVGVLGLRKLKYNGVMGNNNVINWVDKHHTKKNKTNKSTQTKQKPKENQPKTTQKKSRPTFLTL